MITAIGFDGDDTLWHSESLYFSTEQKLCALLAAFGTEKALRERLLQIERRNIELFGYGVKSYMLSMVECALEVSGDSVAGATLSAVLQLGKDLLAAEARLFDGVLETLSLLREKYALHLITKGDLAHQQRKVRQSGLAHAFRSVEIVVEKDTTTYSEVLARLEIRPEEFLMVGNSLRSDVEPVLRLGASAVLVPHEYAWSYEQEHDVEASQQHHVIEKLQELPSLLARLEAKGG